MSDISLNYKHLIKNLPADWRERGAQKFTCSQSRIEKIVYGVYGKEVPEVIDFMLDLVKENAQQKNDIKASIAKKIGDLQP